MWSSCRRKNLLSFYLCFYSLIFVWKAQTFPFQRLQMFAWISFTQVWTVCVCSSTTVSLCAADQKSASAPNVRRGISRSRLQSRSEGMDIPEGGKRTYCYWWGPPRALFFSSPSNPHTLLPPLHAMDAQNTLYSARNNCFCLEGVWFGAPLHLASSREGGSWGTTGRFFIRPLPPPPSSCRSLAGCHLSMGSELIFVFFLIEGLYHLTSFLTLCYLKHSKCVTFEDLNCKET